MLGKGATHGKYFLRLTSGVQSVNGHLSTGSAQDPIHDTDQCGFARTVGSNQPGDSTLFNCETDIMQCLMHLELLGYVAYFDHVYSPSDLSLEIIRAVG
ncbi:hypothetical protein D3C76_1695210 [compost metagenome]